MHVKGQRDSKCFPTRKEAVQWALEREAELKGAKLPDKTFGDAMKRYVRELTDDRAGWRWEAVRLKALLRDSLAGRRLEALAGNAFADWRDRRLKEVKPGTVAREMNLMRSVGASLQPRAGGTSGAAVPSLSKLGARTSFAPGPDEEQPSGLV